MPEILRNKLVFSRFHYKSITKFLRFVLSKSI